MSKTITITIPDEAYEALQSAAQRANRSPEELVADAVTTRFHMVQEQSASSPPEDPVIAVMRARGHLVDPSTLPPYPGVADLPPKGSPEEAQLLEELGNEASDALERMGIDIADLVER
ncbi:MAG: hypothetical protein ACRDHP_02330 [Ktedonobacterales bacterium]